MPETMTAMDLFAEAAPDACLRMERAYQSLIAVTGGDSPLGQFLWRHFNERTDELILAAHEALRTRAPNRSPIPNALRFAVLERDGFACVYCGRRPPVVELHVDHLQPRTAGGANTLENLATACSECNLGKGGRSLCAETLDAIRQQVATGRSNECFSAGRVSNRESSDG